MAAKPGGGLEGTGQRQQVPVAAAPADQLQADRQATSGEARRAR